MTKRGNAKGWGFPRLVTGLAALLLPLDTAAAGQDLYSSFSDLQARAREGVDFGVTTRDVGASITVLAIHGGSIEPGTDTIARAIAGQRFNLYIFRGIRGGNSLHVTSTHFDEPRAMKMVAGSVYAVSVHGEGGSGEQQACIGGGNGALRDRVAERLQQLVRVENPCQRLSGSSPSNIVNRAANQGVQLELSRSLRARLQSDPAFLKRFSNAVRDAVSF